MKKLQLLAITMLLSMPCAMTFTDDASAVPSSDAMVQKLTASVSVFESEAMSLKQHIQELLKDLQDAIKDKNLPAVVQQNLNAATVKLKSVEDQVASAVEKAKTVEQSLSSKSSLVNSVRDKFSKIVK